MFSATFKDPLHKPFFLFSNSGLLLIISLSFAFTQILVAADEPAATEKKEANVNKTKATTTKKIELPLDDVWRDEISSSIKIGDVVNVPLVAEDGQLEKNTFLSFYTKQNLINNRGSILILHDKLSHPDWKNVIRPLRTELPNTGWNTLSIQLPVSSEVIEDGKLLEKFYESHFKRINSAITYLKSQKAKQVMLIAYGTSAISGLRYLQKQFGTGKKGGRRRGVSIKALAMISPYPMTQNSFLKQDFAPLETLKLPILDLYAHNDLDIVTLNGEKRQGMAKRAKNKKYLQQIIHNTDHFYTQQTHTLVKRIHSFFTGFINPKFKLPRPRGQYLLEIK